VLCDSLGNCLIFIRLHSPSPCNACDKCCDKEDEQDTAENEDETDADTGVSVMVHDVHAEECGAIVETVWSKL